MRTPDEIRAELETLNWVIERGRVGRTMAVARSLDRSRNRLVGELSDAQQAQIRD